MCVSVCECVSVYVCVCECVCVSVCVSMCMFICMYVCVCFFISVRFYFLKSYVSCCLSVAVANDGRQ